jgi:hypothetical protein
MSYTVGDLTLSIATELSGSVAPINQTISALNRLSTAITKLNSTQTVFAAQQLTNFFSKLSIATKSIDPTVLSSLASAAKSLSSISRIVKLQDADFTKIAAGFNSLTVALTPFVNKVITAEKALVALDGILRRLGATAVGGGGGGKRTPKSFGFLSAVSWMTVYMIARRLANAVGKLAKAGGDYVETLNLWETSMGRNLDKAEKFVDTMNKAYGISDKTLMQAQATFKNMLGALGNISDDVAYTLSEGVTQMAVDYASLYNKSFEQAFSKFQSALAGQVRPVRSEGFDITENTIYQLYQTLGGTKTMRQLNRTEKQLLSLLAIYRQMEEMGAMGDLAKTMNSYANQARVAKEMLQEIVYYSGTLLTNWLITSGIMPTLVGYLMFFADVLKSAAEATGSIQHFANDPFAGVEEGAENAGDAVDELNGKLLDFDKFRSLSGKEESYITIDDQLVSAFESLSSYMSTVESKAHDIASALKKVSILFDENGMFNEQNWNILTGAVSVFAIALTVGFAALLLVLKPVASAISLAVAGFTLFFASIPNTKWWQSLVTGLAAIAAGIGAVMLLMNTLKMGLAKALVYGLAVAGAVAGLGATIANSVNIKAYKNGGLPDKGTMFLAGEAGAEIVYNNPNGQSGVANIAQIKQAMYQALVEYGRTSGGNDRPIEVYLDGEKVYESTTAHASRHGNKWVKA